MKQEQQRIGKKHAAFKNSVLPTTTEYFDRAEQI